MRKSFSFILVTVVFVALTTGCQKAPQTEIDAAKAAVEAAKTAGADVYLTADYNVLNDSLNAVLESIEKESSKMFRNFDSQKTALTGISESAAKLQEDTKAKIEEVKLQVEGGLAEVKTLIEENKGLVAKAPKGKEGAAALDAIKNDISAIETEVEAANTAYTNGEYMSALGKVQASKEKAVAINTELKDAIAKKGKK